MGRVFSYEELSARQVPDESDFEAARDAFAEGTTQAVDQGLVHGAMIFGSAAIKRTTIRSDLDCFIVLTDETETHWQAAAEIVKHTKEASGGTIPIGAIGRSAAILQSGRHEMERFFGAHLAGPYRLITGEDPAQFITYDNEPALDILESFMISKTRKLSELGWADTPQEKLRILQRTLELPNAVGRKALRIIDELEGSDRSIENSADKTQVGSASIVLFGELGTEKHALDLLEADAQYTQTTQEVLAGTMTDSEYAAVLANIKKKVNPSIGWLIRTYEAFEKRVGGSNRY